MAGFEAVILVGHGGIASDTPPELVSELKQLESARNRRGDPRPSPREIELDRQVRDWPRSDGTDPYKAGLESIAAELGARLGGRRLVVAYNEFCAPSLRDAVTALAEHGAARITIVTTMFTPGGSHSEREMPLEIEYLRKDFPAVKIEYAWPYGLDHIADFLAAHIDRR
jgi:sirohydrochlorin cobaltochelatase